MVMVRKPTYRKMSLLDLNFLPFWKLRGSEAVNAVPWIPMEWICLNRPWLKCRFLFFLGGWSPIWSAGNVRDFQKFLEYAACHIDLLAPILSMIWCIFVYICVEFKWNFCLNLNPFCSLRTWSLIHSVELLVDGVDPWQSEGIRRTCAASSSSLTGW